MIENLKFWYWPCAVTRPGLGRSILPSTQNMEPLKIRSGNHKFVLALPIKPSLKLSLMLSKPLIKFVRTPALKEPVVVSLEVACRNDGLLPANQRILCQFLLGQQR